MTIVPLLQIAFHVVQNAALLTLGVLGYCKVRQWARDRANGVVEMLLYGAAFGLLGIVSMWAPVDAAAGVHLDLRNTVVATATLFGGIDVGVISLVIVVAYRVALGGAGIAAGIASLVITFAVAFTDVSLRRRSGRSVDHRHLLAVGIAVALGEIAVIGLFPPSLAADLALRTVVLEWLACTPLTILLLGAVILHFERNQLLTRALEQRERQLRAIMDNSPFAIFLKDRARRYRLINRTYVDWFGHTPEMVYGKTTAEVDTPTIAAGADASDEEVLERGGLTFLERPVEVGKPGLTHVQITKFPIRDQQGIIVGLAGFITDISERRRLDERLQAREAELRAIFDNAPFGIFLKDRAGRFQLVNRTYAEWFGYGTEAVQGRTARDIFPPAAMEQIDASDRAALERGEVARYETAPRTTTNPAIKYLQVTKFPVRDGEGGIIGAAGFLVDVTERKAADEALRQSEIRFRALIEQSNGVVAVIRPDGTMIHRYPVGEGVLGRALEEALGQSIFSIVHPEDVQSIEETLRRVGETPGGQASGRSRALHRDGSWRHLSWTARNAGAVPGLEGIIINAHDITETHRLQEQLHQSQKMEAVGQLAGGIAHDFNNLLGAILGFARFLMEDLPRGSVQHGFAERIVMASERARDLVQQILAFSRQTPIERQPTDLVRIAQEMRDLLRASLPSSTRLEVTAEPEPLIAEVNAMQISQVLLNLCLNANDALHGEPGRVAVEILRASPAEVAAIAALPNGEEGRLADRFLIGSLRIGEAYARITVTDDGSGISPDVLHRIFDPFFTTKARGRGTGLGLAVVHGLVLAYGGACIVGSRPGSGSAFSVYLPLAAPGRLPTSAPPAVPSLRGRERILVVDDEPDIRDVLTIGLERLGYEVVGLDDPEEALAVISEHPAIWDVVISDQVMPAMKGLTLFSRLKAIRPDLHFILCTGFSDGATEKHALELGVDGFFLKPVAIEELASAIRRLVGDAPRGAMRDRA